MYQMAQLFFSPRTMQGVFDPWLADFRHEVFGDYHDKRSVRILVTRGRYTWLFITHLTAQIAVSVMKPMVAAWRFLGLS